MADRQADGHLGMIAALFHPNTQRSGAMLLLLSGVSLTLLGCLAGSLLAWMPATLADPHPPGLALWVLFPLFVTTGYALAVIGARQTQWRSLTQGLGVLLLLLALSSAIALMLSALGWWQSAAGSLGQWYVLALAGVPGVLGTAATQSADVAS